MLDKTNDERPDQLIKLIFKVIASLLETVAEQNLFVFFLNDSYSANHISINFCAEWRCGLQEKHTEKKTHSRIISFHLRNILYGRAIICDWGKRWKWEIVKCAVLTRRKRQFRTIYPIALHIFRDVFFIFQYFVFRFVQDSHCRHRLRSFRNCAKFVLIKIEFLIWIFWMFEVSIHRCCPSCAAI